MYKTIGHQHGMRIRVHQWLSTSMALVLLMVAVTMVVSPLSGALAAYHQGANSTEEIFSKTSPPGNLHEKQQLHSADASGDKGCKKNVPLDPNGDCCAAVCSGTELVEDKFFDQPIMPEVISTVCHQLIVGIDPISPRRPPKT